MCKRPTAYSLAASKAENDPFNLLEAARRSASVVAKSAPAERAAPATRLPPSAIGVVAERDFERARELLPSLSEYSDYWDWRDEREGLWMGLALAGSPVQMVLISLASLAAWRALAADAQGEEGLDALAATIVALRASPSAYRVFAVVSAAEFAAHPRCAAAVAGTGDYSDWLRRRRLAKSRASATGQSVQEVAVRLKAFLAWRQSNNRKVCEEELDCYASTLFMKVID